MHMKHKLGSTFFLVLMLFIGLCLLLYPSVSNYWNSFHQIRAIAGYAEIVSDIDEQQYKKLISDAEGYNRRLGESPISWNLNEEQQKEYDSMLSVSGSLMAYVEIPKLDITLPIYHGVEDTVLQVGIGHIPGTSLPVGGESSHCVLSGHRGMVSAKLFSDLDILEKGDSFILRTLDEVLTYEVDQIRIVLPNELQDLQIERGKDLCTLVTCTPYGVNSHRLLVRGHRVENIKNTVRVTADALIIEPVMVAPALAVPVLLLLLLWVLAGDRFVVRCVVISTKIQLFYRKKSKGGR